MTSHLEVPFKSKNCTFVVPFKILSYTNLSKFDIFYNRKKAPFYFKQNSVIFFMLVLFIPSQQKNNQHPPQEKKNAVIVKNRQYLRFPFKNSIKPNFLFQSVNKPYIFNQIFIYLHLKRTKTFEIVLFSFEILEALLKTDRPAALILLLLFRVLS